MPTSGWRKRDVPAESCSMCFFIARKMGDQLSKADSVLVSGCLARCEVMLSRLIIAGPSTVLPVFCWGVGTLDRGE
jgi:hypothetical protein